MMDSVHVVIFSGGRGTATIADNLSHHPQVRLTLIINAYDDGLSTGRLRRFIPGMLGPSDVRKNITRLTRSDDRCLKSLKAFLEHRLPVPTSISDGVRCLESICNLSGEFSDPVLQVWFTDLNLKTAKVLAQAAATFLDYFRQQTASGDSFDFSDCSIGNLIFSGLYLKNDRDFNLASGDFANLCEIKASVLNITRGGNLVLVGLKDDGTYLPTESDIVAKQNSSPLREIFLLKNYLGESERANLDQMSLAGKSDFLRKLSVEPVMNSAAADALRSADVIVYGPGTQHSSLFPSYLTHGLGELIATQTHAERIFIGNIHRDHDLQGETTSTLLEKLKFYLSRKNQFDLGWSQILTSVFFQRFSDQDNKYLNLDLDFVKSIGTASVISNFEQSDGAHSGSRVLLELTSIVNQRLQKKLQSFHTSISVVVPALNEERTIKKVLHELNLVDFSSLGMTKEIIVSDGGSTDRTVELAQSEAGVRVLTTDRALGRGEALRKGIQESQGSMIVTFPSDGEYDPRDLFKVVQSLKQSGFKTVWGSRTIKCLNLDNRINEIYQGNWLNYFVSKYGGTMLSFLSWVFYSRFVTDPLTSIKAFDATLIKSFQFHSTGVEFEMETIAHLSRSQTYILEVPVEFQPRTRAQGKKIRLRDGLRCLIEICRPQFRLES